MAPPAGAQYIAPGTSTVREDTTTKEDMEDAYQAARWSAGRLRIDPWFGIREAAYVDNVTGSSQADESQQELESDFTATAGAGLRGYLRIGTKVFWTAHALPEYVWWQDLERKRRLNGRYGVGVFAYFNRLTVEASGRRRERQQYFSAEVQELTTQREDVSRLSVALEVANRLEVFATGYLKQFANQEDESQVFFGLDRESETATAGVRYRAPGGFWAELALEDQTNDFEDGARNLSNSGDGEVLAMGFESGRGEIYLRLASLSLEPQPGSAFRPFDKVIGNFDLRWNPSSRARVLAYARRDLDFSVNAQSSHFVGERMGATFGMVTRAGSFGVFGEFGEDDFEPIQAGAAVRKDDVTAVGANVRILFGDLAALSFKATRTEYDSNLDVFDREITSAGFSFEVGGLLKRLSLGDERDW